MKKLTPFITILSIILLISSATATVHVKSNVIMRKIKDAEEKSLQFDKDSILSLINKILGSDRFKVFTKKLSKQLTGKMVDINIEKIREILEKYRYLLKNSLDASIDITSLRERVKKIFDKVEPQFIGIFGIVLLAIVYIIGWIITFGIYFITTPGAGWLERMDISLIAATFWPIILSMWILT
jgi:hypothetical protein